MFSYFKPKLVQFPNGKFGIMKRRLFDDPKFLGVEGDWWTLEKYVKMYCMFDTEELALERFIVVDPDKVKILATLDDKWDLA